MEQITKTEEREVSQAEKKGGRKSISYDFKGKVDFVKREKAIREKMIADITFSSTDRKLVRELAVRQYLFAHNMTEDYAAKILCFIFQHLPCQHNSWIGFVCCNLYKWICLIIHQHRIIFWMMFFNQITL